MNADGDSEDEGDEEAEEKDDDDDEDNDEDEDGSEGAKEEPNGAATVRLGFIDMYHACMQL
jgi:hypothetical protein